MSIETITLILYIWLPITLLFPACAFWLIYRIRQVKKKLAKQEHANRYYEEMLYASKDGYITFSIYKDKDYQYCSRRLATLLNLKNGENSTLSEITSLFNRSDAEKINASFMVLKKLGTSFEHIAKTKNNKIFLITGTQITSADSEINSNCIWFRDITKTTEFIDRITEEACSYREQLEDYRILIDNIPCPIWLRNENLDITMLNKHYLKLVGLKDFSDVTPENTVLHDLGHTTNFLELAQTAKTSNTPQKKQINILTDGDLKKYEITETPYYDSYLKTTRTIGSLIDITSFDDAKRNYKVHLNSHLEILGALDTAFCIINTKHNFTFGNNAFLKLWNLPENFLNNAPHYNLFLDKIREQKVLPEVSDFKTYKEEENKAFDALTEQKEDLLYIPDGRTFRRIRAPHPDGTLIAYEDITDRLAASRHLSDAIAVQRSILDNITDSIAVFSPTLKLKTYNTAFSKLWNIPTTELETLPSLKELLDIQKKSLPEIEDWKTFRDDMQKHITACNSFTLKLKNKQKINVTPVILPDTSLLVTYRKQ